jgi:hypothetical protein
MMERRMSERMPLSMDVQIYAYGALVANGTIVNVSERGVLLHVLDDLSNGELEEGKHLDVMLGGLSAEPADKWRPIQVVRRDGNGIGALFLTPNTLKTGVR